MIRKQIVKFVLLFLRFHVNSAPSISIDEGQTFLRDIFQLFRLDGLIDLADWLINTHDGLSAPELVLFEEGNYFIELLFSASLFGGPDSFFDFVESLGHFLCTILRRIQVLFH